MLSGYKSEKQRVFYLKINKMTVTELFGLFYGKIIAVAYLFYVITIMQSQST